MRLLGAGLIWTSLIYMGIAYCIKLKRRINILEKTNMLLQQMKIEIEFLHLPLYEILKKITMGENFGELDFLSVCCDCIREGDDFPDAWKKAVSASSLPYKSEEKDKLLLLGSNLGTTDVKSQLTVIEMYCLYFQQYLDFSKQRYKKYGNLSTLMGVLMGCVVFILLI